MTPQATRRWSGAVRRGVHALEQSARRGLHHYRSGI